MARDGARDALTGEALAGLLARLDPDPNRAGEKYEALRTALVRFFDWRGAPFPDDCADQAIDRLARRIADNEPIADVRSYGLGIARLVWLEQSRAPSARTTSLDEAVVTELAVHAEAAEELPLADCFEKCLAELPDDGRDLILRYYTHEHHGQIEARAALAQELKLSGNALRSRAQRVRDRLERCVHHCAQTEPSP